MTFWYWLLSWLPFEWAAPDTMLFMKNALLAVLVVTPLFGLLSTMVVESRMAFFSDAPATPPLPAWPSALSAA